MLRSMLSHVSLGTTDLDRAQRFHDAFVLDPDGHKLEAVHQ